MIRTPRISTCLWFDSAGLEAAEFYVSLFDRSEIVSVTLYGEGAPMPAGAPMLVRFELDGVPFAALNGGPVFSQSEAVSIVAACDTQDEIDRLWSALTANGGSPSQCGWLKDRFGVSWQVIPSMLGSLMASGDGAKIARVMQAIMPMSKINLAALDAAARA